MRVCATSGMKFVLSCAGPLCSDLDGIETFFKSVFNAQPARFDSTVLDIPWREVSPKPSLRIGVIPECSVFPLHPPIHRVLNEAVRLLEAQGHQIIHLPESDCRIMETNEIGWKIFSLDQGSKRCLESGKEPPVPAMQHIGMQAQKLVGFYKSSLPDTSALDPLQTLAVLNTHRAELREAYRELWLEHNLDICIAPPAQTTAVQHDTFGVPPYTLLTNVLDVGHVFLGCSISLCSNKYLSSHRAFCHLAKWVGMMPRRPLYSTTTSLVLNVSSNVSNVILVEFLG